MSSQWHHPTVWTPMEPDWISLAILFRRWFSLEERLSQDSLLSKLSAFLLLSCAIISTSVVIEQCKTTPVLVLSNVYLRTWIFLFIILIKITNGHYLSRVWMRIVFFVNQQELSIIVKIILFSLLGAFAFQRDVTRETGLKSKEKHLYRWYFTNYVVVW